MKLDDARKIIDAGLAKAKEIGVNISIVVVNEEAHVISLSRMDGAGFLTPDIAVRPRFKLLRRTGRPSFPESPSWRMGVSSRVWEAFRS